MIYLPDYIIDIIKILQSNVDGGLTEQVETLFNTDFDTPGHAKVEKWFDRYGYDNVIKVLAGAPYYPTVQYGLRTSRAGYIVNEIRLLPTGAYLVESSSTDFNSGQAVLLSKDAVDFLRLRIKGDYDYAFFRIERSSVDGKIVSVERLEE